MQANLKAKNRHLVVIIDPHIKRDSNYHVHSGATEKGLYVKNKEGKDYEGWCWPGQSSWLDFLRPEAREYWIEQLALDSYKGSTDILHVWNDMNEVGAGWIHVQTMVAYSFRCGCVSRPPPLIA